ncbi:ISXO2 transposase-like protein [Thiobaca trueperi]|uniref:ISXO2 transposase-like protein n=1 Tax=Thiobaca trueperi TaxID=127458 RepID=A0A4V2V2A1_9GAMM|nr:ISXO2 transposase-like protein [Thiobaca trueperi]
MTPTSAANSPAALQDGARRTRRLFSLYHQGHPLRAKFTPLPGFTRRPIADGAGAHLAPFSTVVSDGLACFTGVTDIGRTHQPTVVGMRKPEDLPMFRWVNTVLGNLKTGFSEAYHRFDFGRYTERYLGAIAYRFNRRFDLQALPTRLLVAALVCPPCPESWIRRVAEAPF